MSILHFCIDMQRGELEGQPPEVRECLTGNVLSLIQALDARNIPTVHILFGGDIYLPPFENGVGHFQDMPRATREIIERNPGLGPVLPLSGSALVAVKNTCSVEDDFLIDGFVRKYGYSTFLLSGGREAKEVSEENPLEGHCLSETARGFSRVGDKVVVVAEATLRGIEESRCFNPLALRRKLHGSFGVRVDPKDEVLGRIDRAKQPLPARIKSRLACLLG